MRGRGGNLMGLTIHYSLSIGKADYKEAEEKVHLLRKACTLLPFQTISEVKEFSRNEITELLYSNHDSYREWKFLVTQSCDLRVEKDEENGIESYSYVAPRAIIAFEAAPAEGSEPANLGLRELEQESGVWTWNSFCKTQYAYEYGGVENFVKAHLLVVNALDIAKSLGFRVEVEDEGEYWESRNLTKLLETLKLYNNLVQNIKDFMELFPIWQREYGRGFDNDK